LNAVILQWVYKPTMSWLLSTWQYFNQIASLSLTPWLYNFTSVNWENFIDLLAWILTNPIFYWIILVVLVLSLITFSD
jgi:hypothetical protein